MACGIACETMNKLSMALHVCQVTVELVAHLVNETSMDNVQVTVNSALTSHIEQLKAENLKLHNQLKNAGSI